MPKPLWPSLLLTLLLGCWAGLQLQARSLVIESFAVEIRVNPDSSIDVHETIRPRFTGSWNGIYRTIPVEYRTPQGFNYDLYLDLQAVTDGSGRPLRHKSSSERHYRKIMVWVPGARDATRTVVLQYRVRNGLKFFEEHDELYWNVTGDEWEIPIEAARARIVLPESATGLRALAFTGSYGSQQREADVSVRGNEVLLRMQRPLAFREGLTAVVGWDKGIVREPSRAEKTLLFLRANWIVLLPLSLFALMYLLWYARGRDPRLRPITTRYEPPQGMSPAEVGTLVDNSPNMRDITASLVDLAVRGFLVIQEKEEEKLLLTSRTEYSFQLTKPADQWGELLPHERKLLDSVFAKGAQETVALSDLRNKFYRSLPKIRDRIFERLLEHRYYASRPDKVKRRWVIGAAVVAGICLWLGGAVSALTGLGQGSVTFVGLTSAVIILVFGLYMPARTVAGTRALEGVLGFEEFMNRVEADRYQRVTKSPEMFEKYLPFAMALGVEKSWVKAFEGIYTEEPQWYQGNYRTGFRPGNFVNNLGEMSKQAGRAMASAPRSSGGSGFSGGGSSGGSSGGGFGGGGGGGF